MVESGIIREKEFTVVAIGQSEHVSRAEFAVFLPDGMNFQIDAWVCVKDFFDGVEGDGFHGEVERWRNE